VRIYIASADSTIRLSLLMLVESEPGLVVIGMSDRAESLLTIVQAMNPEVLLLDYELAKQATAGLVGDLHHLPHPPKITVLSIDPHAKASALAAGADAFINKNVPPDELLPILRQMRSLDTGEPVAVRPE